MPNLIKSWWQAGQELTAGWANAVADWINWFEAVPPLICERNHKSVRLALADGLIRNVLPVKITGRHADSPAGYHVYLGDVYANGQAEDPTEEDVTVMLAWTPDNTSIVLPVGQTVLGAKVQGLEWIGAAETHAETVWFCQFDWNRPLLLTVGGQAHGSVFECDVTLSNNWTVAWPALVDLLDYDANIAADEYVGQQAIGFLKEWDGVNEKDKFVAYANIRQHQVKVSADDELPEYLADKIVAGEAITVGVVNDGGAEDLSVGLDIDSLGALGTVDPDGDYLAIYDASEGTHAKVLPDTLHDQATNAFKVKVDASDTTAEFLHDKIKDQASYAGTTADVLVKGEAVDADPKNLRLFLDDPAGAGLAVSGGKLVIDIAGQTEHTSGDTAGLYLLVWNGSALRKISVENVLSLLADLGATPAYGLGKDGSGNVGWVTAGCD